MTLNKFILPLCLSAVVFSACTKDDVEPKKPIDPIEPEVNLEIETFLYTGMNNIYLYKNDVPQLGDTYFASDEKLKDFLKSFDSPEELFEDGLMASQDRFSFLVDDYVSLENSFSGKATTNGMQYALYRFGEINILAVVNYVLPNTSAEAEGIQRGDVFFRVDGVEMTEDNYQSLLANQTYTIEVSYLDGNTITPTGVSKTLTKEEYETNPVYIVDVLEIEGQKVGYLMYNSFTSNYDADLNAAFAELKAAGITDLVLDLRYNGGGSVETAVDISSMITGQFEGEIFMKEQWNDLYQSAWEEESYLNRFNNKINTGELINSLNLSKVYVLTTKRTASASELVINGLDPYIDVVQVGGTTTGKFQASVTLYDSSNFGRENANPNHTYAMQPLVLKSVNAEGKSDYIDGLPPDVKVDEDLANLGVLGDPEEPVLKAALNHILGLSQDVKHAENARMKDRKFEFVGETNMESPIYQKMYINELPSLDRE